MKCRAVVEKRRVSGTWRVVLLTDLSEAVHAVRDSHAEALDAALAAAGLDKPAEHREAP